MVKLGEVITSMDKVHDLSKGELALASFLVNVTRHITYPSRSISRDYLYSLGETFMVKKEGKSLGNVSDLLEKYDKMITGIQLNEVFFTDNPSEEQGKEVRLYVSKPFLELGALDIKEYKTPYMTKKSNFKVNSFSLLEIRNEGLSAETTINDISYIIDLSEEDVYDLFTQLSKPKFFKHLNLLAEEKGYKIKDIVDMVSNVKSSKA